MAWHGSPLPPWRIFPAALSAGALAPADVVHHGALVEPMGRSHDVYRVSVGGAPRFFLKVFGPSRGSTDGLASRERAVLALAGERPELAALVPAAWPWEPSALDSSWQVVATVAVRGAEAWKLERAGGGDRSVDEAWRELVAALAVPLAAMHRATRHLARPGAAVPPGLEPIEPWGLRLMDGDAAPELWASPPTAALLREAAADAGLVAGLRAARALWRPMALVHGDLKHDNVLLETVEGGPARVRVLDWEMARLGDPAWDLATLTARLTVARGDGPPWVDQDLDAVAELLRAYVAASGLAAPPLALRLVRYVGAALLMMALQLGSTLSPGEDSAPARRLIMRARATFAGADGLTAGILARVETRAA